MANKPKFGYWDIRGLAQPARFIFAYVGAEYEDVRYKIGPAPEYNRDDWFSVKFKLGLPFPNLPYYIDRNIKLTGSNAIYRYLGRKYNLAGETEEEKANCDLILEVTMDLRNAFVNLCYGPNNSEEKRQAYLTDAKKKIEAFNAFLGDKKFFTGDKITVCDFHMYEMLDQNEIFEPTILNDFPKLKAYCQRFREFPTIKAYLASDKFQARPINNANANWT